MIDKNLNFSKLISSYLFCKSIDDFLNNENGFYDLSNLGLLKSSIENIKLIQNDAYANIRFKIAFSYLINQYGAFFKNKNEESFFSILGTLFNENLNRFITLDILTEIRSITLKKASVLLREKFFNIHEEKVEDLIRKDPFFANDTNENETYTNETFYTDLSEIFSQKVEYKNTSILFEISNFHDLKNENEEENLVKKFQSMKNGIDIYVSPSEKRKPKLETSMQKKTTINSNTDELMNIQYNDDEERPVSPVIGIQNRMSFALEEPTASKLRATRVSSIEPNGIQQDFTQFQDDSDDELNFNLTTRAKQTRKSKELALERSTSSPKPTTSRLANAESALPNDSDSSVEFRNKTRKKSSKNYESSSKEELVNKSAQKRRKSIKKKARVDDSSELSEIDTDSDSDVKKKSSHETKKGVAQNQRTRWTENETIYLAIGVELYGKGNWAKILKRFNEQLKARNSVHLKDKYRNLERADEIKRYSKIAKSYIQKNNYEK